MVTFFQTITGIIGQRIDGSQQGGGGGENPNPPIENNPELRLFSQNKKYKLYQYGSVAPTDFELRFTDLEFYFTGIQESNPEFRMDLTNKMTGDLLLTYYRKNNIVTQFGISEEEYNLLDSGIQLLYKVTYVSNGIDIKSSNTVTCTKEA